MSSSSRLLLLGPYLQFAFDWNQCPILFFWSLIVTITFFGLRIMCAEMWRRYRYWQVPSVFFWIFCCCFTPPKTWKKRHFARQHMSLIDKDKLADARVKPGTAVATRCVQRSVIWVELETMTENKTTVDPWQRLVSQKQNMFNRWVKLKVAVGCSQSNNESISIQWRGMGYWVLPANCPPTSDAKLLFERKPGGASENAQQHFLLNFLFISALRST